MISKQTRYRLSQDGVDYNDVLFEMAEFPTNAETKIGSIKIKQDDDEIDLSFDHVEEFIAILEKIDNG